MTFLEQQELSKKDLYKFLKKSIKKIILENGIDPNTKKGNQELDVLIKKNAKLPFNSTAQVQSLGEKIGHLIVKLSTERGKLSLDQGIIRHILLKEDLMIATEDPTFTSSKVESSTSITEMVQDKRKPTVEPSKILDEDEEQIILNQSSEVEEETDGLDEELGDAELDDDDEETDGLDEELGDAELDDDDEEISSTSSAVVKDDDALDADKLNEEPVKAVETPTNKDISSTSLKERIGEDIKNAMKAQDKIRLETVRGIKKVLIEKEVALRPSGQDSLTPEQEIEVLTQQAKQRRDSIEQYTKAGREDLANKEAQELAIIETYLPKQLTDDELTDIIDEIITSVGATSAKDLGKVMGVAIKQLKGKADGKKIQDWSKVS
ncbi:GatB/YqeY domain-containing protein [Chroococcus sp. FPU101]|uniref:GatB/YqeY domain-containing protein n=1 Tax=Chroococcus sp. FPU101 TaxID=1974212 RepID=UPI001AA2A105|nr:GatB/YqeY domain-containing protein [Chroococcus sp. FPU101]GFE67493.1 hypothetical protein CFPU101_01030 [Chroococcus sp. FPU101]